jgi:hypothetical protein
MILDKLIDKKTKLIIATLSASIWIYFRTLGCYAMLPRKSCVSVLLVIVWIYLYETDVLFLPLGLLLMTVYSQLIHKKCA